MDEAKGRNLYFEGQFGEEDAEAAAQRVALVKERDALQFALKSLHNAQGATLAPVAWMSKSQTSPEDWPRLGDRRQLAQDYDASHGYGVQADRARQKEMTPLVSLDEAMRLINTLRFALKGLHDDIAEYARINHIGGFDNHWMKAARDALGEKPSKAQMLGGDLYGGGRF